MPIQFKKEDFEGNGTQYNIGDIKLRVWKVDNGKYACKAEFKIKNTNHVCRSDCKHFKDAIKSAVGKLVMWMIEGEYVSGVTDSDGSEYFNKAFIGEYDDGG